MFLAPSNIYFIKDCLTNSLKLTAADESLITSVSNKICENNVKNLPKMQVSEKNGAWFALNNSSLHIYRELEKKGKCSRIKVDVVDLNKVPYHVQSGMLVPNEPPNSITTKLQNEDIVDGAGAQPKLDSAEDPVKGFDKLTVGGLVCSNTSQNITSTSVPNEDDVDDGRHNLMGDDGRRGSTGGDSDASSSFSGSDYSDEDEDPSELECDEDLTCNVCDRSFDSTRQLALHQQKKRHFGCSVCDSIFPSLMRLEHHKESLDHWSEDEGNTHDSDSEDDSDDEVGKDSKIGELERLL